MFFDLRSRTSPIECSPHVPFDFSVDCKNGEVVDHDLVISKLSLEVYHGFGEYGRCNICGPSGVDPFSRLPCTPNEYFCTCGSYFFPYACNEQRLVGRENISTAFRDFNPCTWENWVKSPWICWGWGVFHQTGGLWYSTTRAGWCDAPGSNPLTCTWRATVQKIVNKTCSDDTIFTAVERYDEAGDGCFKRCPSSTVGNRRNTSDPCWIYCFYATVRGEKALLPGGHDVGMPLEKLDAAFQKPFLPEALGGCPSVPQPETTSSAPRLQSEAPGSGRWAKQRSSLVHRWYQQAAAKTSASK
ncbi:MAG: hypothetical protein SGPRY_008721 [Prymnesium sp.]